MPFQSYALMVFTCFASNLVVAQPTTDSVFVAIAITHAKELHHSVLAENLALYNGVVNDKRYTSQTGHPYFLYNEAKKGSIVYNAGQYHDVPLLYDITVDAVLTETADHLHNLQLVHDKIERFNIGERQFVRLQPKDTLESALPEGFYEVLYSGHLLALAKRVKRKWEQANGISLQTTFKSYDYYYIISGDRYHTITSNKTLLSLFGKQRAQVNAYLRSNHLSFKKDAAQTIKSACMYFEQLTQ